MSTPRLSRDVVAALARRAPNGVELPPPSAIGLPEKVLQFGTGAFLRGFVDYFIDAANRAGTFGGSVVTVSSTSSRRNQALDQQDGLFTLVTQGIDDGAP